MTPDKAVLKSTELNESGLHKENWFYYPAYHEGKKEWFVMRRLKKAHVVTAVFFNGVLSVLEK